MPCRIQILYRSNSAPCRSPAYRFSALQLQEDDLCVSNESSPNDKLNGFQVQEDSDDVSLRNQSILSSPVFTEFSCFYLFIVDYIFIFAFACWLLHFFFRISLNEQHLNTGNYSGFADKCELFQMNLITQALWLDNNAWWTASGSYFVLWSVLYRHQRIIIRSEFTFTLSVFWTGIIHIPSGCCWQSSLSFRTMYFQIDQSTVFEL